MSLFSTDKTTNDDGHINVLAEFNSKPEHAEEIRTMLLALVEPTRAEDGCKDYHLLEGKHDPNKFVTFESWTSEDKLHKHLDGVQTKLAQAKPMLAEEAKITIFNHLK